MSEMHSHSQPHTRNSVTGDVRTRPDPETGETRAGPGDAGASDEPRPLPKSDQYRRRNRAAGPFTLGVIAVGALVVVLLWLVF